MYVLTDILWIGYNSVMSELMKLTDVLKEIPVSRTNMIKWIRDGKVKGIRLGKKWFVLRDEVERIKREGVQ